MKNLYRYIYLLAFFSFFSAAQVFDNSVTHRFASEVAYLYWPEGNFAKFHKEYAQPIAQLDIQDVDREHSVKIDLSNIKLTNPLFITLSSADGNKGVADFYSVEKGGYNAPQLTFEQGNKKRLLLAEIDTYIAKKNRKAVGTKSTLKAGGGHTILLKFQFAQKADLQAIKNLSLVLTTTNRQYGKSKLQANQIIYSPVVQQQDNSGIAQKYVLDKGIKQDKAVYFADDFDDQGWFSGIKQSVGLTEPVWQNTGELQFIDHSDVRHYSGQPGKSVNMRFLTSQNLAGNLDYYFAQHAGKEPEEAFFRYYSMLAPGAKVSGGGKLPGFSGTYNKAGWGGRPNNGENGWSARGAFYHSISSKSPEWGGQLPIGSYLYEANTGSKYGKSIPWGHEMSTMQPGRWYAIEQQIKLNTPGLKDGVFKVWIDGVLIYERNNMYFRDTPQMKIEKVWLNYYFGGVAKPKNNFNMYLDNIVIASSYIGPIRK
ncbi:polysaccharide lyase [Aliiglaciecola lipolytica]|nr:hypothetical protein [Aliiglaciecola lipolytica]